nr:hypothetical protein [uncultured Carboxylicivirga sp.]
MNKNNVLKLRSSLAVLSLLLIAITLFSTYHSPLKIIYPLFYLPIIYLLIRLAIANYKLKLYKRALLNSTLLLASIMIALFSLLKIPYQPAILFFYYLIIFFGIIYSSLFKSPIEKGYIFFEDVRNLPPVVLTLTAPIILAFGIQLYFGIVKSDYVLNLKSSIELHNNESSISNPLALQTFREARQALHINEVKNSTILLKKSLEKQPQNAYILYALYINSTIEKNYEEAFNYITDAISSDPSSTRYLCEKAYLLFANNEYNQMKHLYSLAKKINPHCPNTYFIKAHIAYYIDNEIPSVTYAYLDSAYWYCDNTTLKYQLEAFKNENCGIYYYLNKIKPYQRNTLTHKLFFYSKVEEKPVIVIEKNNNNEMHTLGDQTILGVKNFIKFNNDHFKDEEVLFYYYFIDDQRYLKVLLETNSKLSISELYQLFQSDLFSKKVEVEIFKEPSFRYL